MNTPSLGHSGLKMHQTCGVNTPCKRGVKYHAVEKGRRRKEKERRKEEEWRTEEGRREERRRKEGRRWDGNPGNGSEPYWSWWTKLGFLLSSVSVLISDSRASVPGTPADQRDSLQAWNIRGLLCLCRCMWHETHGTEPLGRSTHPRRSNTAAASSSRSRWTPEQRRRTAGTLQPTSSRRQPGRNTARAGQLRHRRSKRGEKRRRNVRDVTSVGQRSSPVPCPARGRGRIQPRVQAGFTSI